MELVVSLGHLLPDSIAVAMVGILLHPATAAGCVPGSTDILEGPLGAERYRIHTCSPLTAK